ncbi:hypothetical protein D3C80_1864050 [compost metagenome]
MRDLKISLGGKKLARKMDGRADTGRGVCVFTRLRLQEGDQLFDGIRLYLVGIDHQHVRQARNQRNRRKSLFLVIWQGLVERLIDRVRANRSHTDRIAIRL